MLSVSIMTLVLKIGGLNAALPVHSRAQRNLRKAPQRGGDEVGTERGRGGVGPHAQGARICDQTVSVAAAEPWYCLTASAPCEARARAVAAPRPFGWDGAPVMMASLPLSNWSFKISSRQTQVYEDKGK